MKIFLLVVTLLSSIFCFAQEFVLAQPDILKLKEASQQGVFKGNLLHLFLTQNYEGTPEISQDAGTFEQISFGENIVYTQVDSPQEGVLERIAIPKTSRTFIIKWVEALNKFYGDDDQNVWSFDQTSYAPIDNYGGGVGIYKITWEKEHIYIDRVQTGC